MPVAADRSTNIPVRVMAFLRSSSNRRHARIDASVEPEDVLGVGYTVVASNPKPGGLIADSADGQLYDFASYSKEEREEHKRNVLAKAAEAGLAVSRQA
jgi:hypothetical protein